MRALTRPLFAGALVAGALLATPAQAAAPSDIVSLVCGSAADDRACDPFWLFRPCGPIVKCP